MQESPIGAVIVLMLFMAVAVITALIDSIENNKKLVEHIEYQDKLHEENKRAFAGQIADRLEEIQFRDDQTKQLNARRNAWKNSKKGIGYYDNAFDEWK